jgi:hypothetical protein
LRTAVSSGELDEGTVRVEDDEVEIEFFEEVELHLRETVVVRREG